MFPSRRVGAWPLRATLLIISLSITSVFIHVQRGQPHLMDRAIYSLVSPLHNFVSGLGRGARGVWLDYFALVNIRTEAKLLKQDLAQSRMRESQLEGILEENRRLRGLLELAEERKDLRLKAARVIGRSNSHLFRVMSLQLEGGEASGIGVGMPVLADGGLIGRIAQVDDGAAEVMLLTDPRSAVDIMLKRSNARGVLVGMGQSETYLARVQYLDRDARVADGEQVLTTGDDGRFPRGLSAGRLVLPSEQSTGPFRDAFVVPDVSLTRLEEVFIVLGRTGLNAAGTRFETSGREP